MKESLCLLHGAHIEVHCTLRLELGAIRGAIKIIKEVYSVGQDSLLSSFSIIPLAFLECSRIK